MIFSSLVFLCIFLPVTYILHWIIPSFRAKNGLLIIASLLFYAYGEPVHVLLMILSAFINYEAALMISHLKRGKKFVLFLGVLANLGMLGFFKYSAFFVDTVNRVLHKNISCPEILLPVGISFFTFQAVSYVIDVYRGKVGAQKSFLKVLLYICFFPQLIAGPIVKYRDISVSLENRKCSSRQTAAGLRRFICGLAKKVLIANAMGTVADSVFGAEWSHINAVTAWIGAVAYLMQIYYDFSGYSDMAIGLGNMFGFRFRENFRYPYGAVSIQDFWRRWHISLSEWFKEYVYIPLGGNRNGRFLTVVNRMVVFFLTGLWHGANWTFILWGLYHGFFMLLEECLPVVRKLPEWIGRIYTVLAVCVGFVMFRSDTVLQGIYYIRQMFTGFWTTPEAVSFAWQQMTPYFIVMLTAAVIGSAPIHRLADWIREEVNDSSKETVSVMWLLLNIGSVILLAWCMFRLSASTYNPFIYFRF
ncbi:MAG: MBOAT family protein [Lachnospiraceae bacterium]|nr:MBOAT family protein [Lachnospiraceae bacterium]